MNVEYMTTADWVLFLPIVVVTIVVLIGMYDDAH